MGGPQPGTTFSRRATSGNLPEFAMIRPSRILGPHQQAWGGVDMVKGVIVGVIRGSDL